MIRYWIPQLLAAYCAFAQGQPDAAHVHLYFPQIADGGPKSQQWQTTFTFVNAGQSPASVALLLFTSEGSPWSVDLGSGAASRHEFTVPPGGSRTLRSRMAAAEVVGGWAQAYSNVPVHAAVTLRQSVNGLLRQEIGVPPGLPATDHIFAANKYLNIAIANVAQQKVTIQARVQDADGKPLTDTMAFNLAPLGQVSFVITDLFPELKDFSGVLLLGGGNRPNDSFIAWAAIEDSSGVMSTLPPGAASWPISHADRIWLVYSQVLDTARRLGMLTSPPELRILTGKEVNAFAQSGTTVSITLGLSELISDSQSELAFALAHELGHIYQQRNNGSLRFHANAEFDADVWGALLALASGYDPYGAAGTLAKLGMATGRAGLVSQFEDQLSSDAHKSFNARLENVFDSLVAACSASEEMKRACADYKSLVHPSLPDIAPLATGAASRR